MSIDDMIAVLQAAKAGKGIEEYSEAAESWYATGLGWMLNVKLRVKPEPREWWLPDDYAPMTGPPKTHGFDVKWVRVREVLE